jgi:hypothetical protein
VQDYLRHEYGITLIFYHEKGNVDRRPEKEYIYFGKINRFDLKAG